MRCGAHRLEVSPARDQTGPEQFLDGRVGEEVAIAPNVAIRAFGAHRIDFPLVLERTP
jgi:hypothetical protein